MTRRMKKPAIIFFVALISSALLSSALAGCSKKPRSIFDYKDCVFSGTSGLLKTVEPEDNNGYSLVLLSAGSPVKLLDWNKERERFHVRAQKGLASGWCGVDELEFKPNVLDFLDDFILQDKELLKNIIQRIKFEKLSEINDKLLMLCDIVEFETEEDARDFWNGIFYYLTRERIKTNDFERLKGKPCVYLKWVDLDTIPNSIDSNASALNNLDKIPYVPMGQNEETPLIRAMKNGCKNYFDAALRTEWDLTVQDKFGKNVFDYAREQGFSEIESAKNSSNKKADYEEIANNWIEYAPKILMEKLNEPKERRFHNSQKLDLRFRDKQIEEALDFAKEKTKFDIDEQSLSVAPFGYSIRFGAIGQRYHSVCVQHIVTSQKEKIPVAAMERLKVFKGLPFEHLVKIGEKTIRSNFLLVQKEDGRIGMIDSLSLAHISSGRTDWHVKEFGWHEEHEEALKEIQKKYPHAIYTDIYQGGMIVTGYKTLLATLFTAGKGKSYIGNLYLVEENFTGEGHSTDLAVQPVCFDDMIELANINLDNRGGDKESVNSEISLELEISESDKPIAIVNRELCVFKNFDRFIVANKNAYLLDGGRLSHLFTINAWPGYSSLRVRFYSAPKSGLCLYGDEQFKNQYEAWRFSDSGEILSHQVFRGNQEYEEYLKTIYKTEDSK